MKKQFLIGLTAVTLLTSVAAVAGGVGGGECREKRGHFGDRGSQGFQKGKHQRLFRTVLKLSDITNEQIGAIYRDIESTRELKREIRQSDRMRQHRNALLSALSEKGFDSKAFVESRVASSTIKANFEAEALNKIFSHLTPKQRVELKTLIEQEPGRNGKRD